MQSDPTAPKVARVYLRVSTDEQDLQRQEAITGQAKAAGATASAAPPAKTARRVRWAVMRGA